MFNDLPDVLIGDVFADAVLQEALEPREPTIEPSLAKTEEKDIKDNPAKQQRAFLSSSQMISSLPGSAQFFALTCAPVSSGSSSSSSSPPACDACGLMFKKSSVFIRCAECTDPIVDLCVYCFGNGAELGSHLRSHAYVTVQAKSSQIFRHSRQVSKLNIFQMLRIMEQVEKRGCFNFSELEKSLGLVAGEGEKVYLEIVTLLSACSEVSKAGDYGPAPIFESLSGGLANMNPLRDEFEHEYVPEAETLLAAVNLQGSDQPERVPEELVSLFNGYNGILDERERRRKVLKSAKMITLRDFFNILKKKKTDEREMFEKLRIFVRPALLGSDDPWGFLEQLAASLTLRKRLIDRVKRLLLLKKNGINSELGEALQFDIDRKKRNDINARRSVNKSVKLWTSLPIISESSSTVGGGNGKRGTRGTTLPVAALPDKSMTVEQAVHMLPSGTDAPIDICSQLQISPQHVKVIQIAVHSVLKIRGKDVPDETLFALIKEGVFGTIRRYLLAAQGLPVSAVATSPFSEEEMKRRLIQYCRLSYPD